MTMDRRQHSCPAYEGLERRCNLERRRSADLGSRSGDGAALAAVRVRSPGRADLPWGFAGESS
jgi:hypothetical protein